MSGARVNNNFPFLLEPAVADELKPLLDKFKEEYLANDKKAKLMVSREDADGTAIVRLVSKRFTAQQLDAFLAVLKTLV